MRCFKGLKVLHKSARVAFGEPLDAIFHLHELTYPTQKVPIVLLMPLPVSRCGSTMAQQSTVDATNAITLRTRTHSSPTLDITSTPNVEMKASYLMSEPHARHCNSPSTPNFPSVYRWSPRDALVSCAVQIMVRFECCVLWCLYTYGDSPSPIPPCACLNGRETPTFERPMLDTRTSNLCAPGFNLTFDWHAARTPICPQICLLACTPTPTHTRPHDPHMPTLHGA